METDPIRMCELLVGLGEVEVLGVNDPGEGPLGVGIRTQTGKPLCPNCDGLVWSKGEAVVNWWICQRSVGRCGCGGTNAAGCALTERAGWGRSPNRTNG